jgi:hypothetical protein
MARRARADDSERLLRGQLHDCSCRQGEAREVAGLNGWAVNAHHGDPGLRFLQNRLPARSALLFGRSRLARVLGADLQTAIDMPVVANALLRPAAKG